MDPHSTLSQFNQRTPKVGPLSSKLRYAETPTKLLAEKRPNSGVQRPVTMHSPFPLVRRPIATNSRIKQDEKYRKDMYLVFVNNALQQKAGVRISSRVITLFPRLTMSEGIERAIQ